jgi:hypothetical protein
MSVTMRILQEYDVRHEREFLALERKFADLERTRPDFPKGRRLKPISAAAACNTLVWQGEFPSLDAANAALAFFEGNPAHEELFRQQVPFFRSVRVEFYENLDL